MSNFEAIADIFEDFRYQVLDDLKDKAMDVLNSLGAGPLIEEVIELKETVVDGVKDELDKVIAPLEEYADDFLAQLKSIQDILQPFVDIISGGCNKDTLNEAIVAARQKVLQKNRQMKVQESCHDAVGFAITLSFALEVAGHIGAAKLSFSVGLSLAAGIQLPCGNFFFTLGPIASAGAAVDFPVTPIPKPSSSPRPSRSPRSSPSPRRSPAPSPSRPPWNNYAHAKHAVLEQQQEQQPSTLSKAWNTFKNHTALSIGVGLAISWNTNLSSDLTQIGITLGPTFRLPNALNFLFENVGLSLNMGEPGCSAPSGIPIGLSFGIKSMSGMDLVSKESWGKVWTALRDIFTNKKFRVVSDIKNFFTGFQKESLNGLGMDVSFSGVFCQSFGSQWLNTPTCSSPSAPTAPTLNLTNTTSTTSITAHEASRQPAPIHQKFLPLHMEPDARSRMARRYDILAERLIPIATAHQQKFHVTSNFLADLAGTLQTAAKAIKNGAIVVPFCLGNCDVPSPDLRTVIRGAAKVGLTSTCKGVRASVTVEYLTIGQLLYVLGSDYRDPLLEIFGMKNVGVALEATTEYVKLAAYGTPWIGTEPTDEFGKFLVDMIDLMRVGADVQLHYGGSLAGMIVFEAAFGLAPDYTEPNFAFVDPTGKMGMRFFRSLQIAISTGDLTIRTGVFFPLRLCVQNCFAPLAERYFLYFIGSLDLIISEGQQGVIGQLTMEGWWWEVFFIPFLHIADVVLSIELDLKQEGAPTALTVGGAACVGKQRSCQTRTGYYIEARVYVGLNRVNQDDDWFVVMTTERSFLQYLGIFSDIINVGSLLSGIPEDVLHTGIYPLKYDPSCQLEYLTPAKPHAMNMNCYAFISYSNDPRLLPFKLTTLSIPAGLVVQGTLNLFGWHMSLALEVSTNKIKVEADMDFLALPTPENAIIRLGRRLVNNQATGNPTFHVLLQKQPPAAYANIQAAFDIPQLKSYGEGKLVLNAEVLEFRSQMYLFDGAWHSHVEMYWKWDLSYFELKLEDIGFANIISIYNMRILLDRKNMHALFSAELSCLNLVRIGGTLEYRWLSGGVQQFGFEVHANVVVGYARAYGTIWLAPNIVDSRVDLHGSVEFSVEALKEVGRAIEKFFKGVVEYATDAWNRVSDRVERRWNTIKTVSNQEFSGMASSLARGDVAGAMHHFGTVIEEAFNWCVGVFLDILDEIAGALLHFLGLIFGGYVKERKMENVEGSFNSVGCQMQRAHMNYCVTILFITICKWEEAPPEKDIGEPECMNRKNAAAAKIKKAYEEIQAFEEIMSASKDENPGIALASGQLDNLAELFNFGTMVFGPPDSSGKTQMQVPTQTPVLVRGKKFHVLQAEGSSAFQENPASVDREEPLDFSDPITSKLSMMQAQNSIGGGMADTLLAGQGRFRPELLATAMITLAPPVLGPGLPAILQCDQNITLGDLAPPIYYVHPLCGYGLQLVMEGLHSLPPEGFRGRVCGSRFYSIHWRVYDHRACGQHSELVEQTVTSLPVAPIFTKVPGPVTITTGKSLSPDSLGRPLGKTPCGQEFNITYHDELPVMQSCGRWTIKRVWTITLYLDPTDCVMPEDRSTSVTQFITVVDNEAPDWVYLPPSLVEVPFFENYQTISPLPLVVETAHPDMIALGLVSYPTRLSSKDKALVFSSTALAEEASCQKRGLASMDRIWTVTDACGNSRTFEQSIVIQFPPSTPVSIQPWDPESRLFSYAPGIEPIRDACNPGKHILGGPKTYVETYGPPTANDTCVQGSWWTPNGCRENVWADFKYYRMEVHAPAPYFTDFPADANITTDASLDPDDNDDLGQPTGASYCGSPFTISYHDAPPVQQGCGLWTIERTWRIQPHYADCGGAESIYPKALTTTKVQLIRISDGRAPEWMYKPPEVLHIPFFNNYQPEDYTPVMRERASADMLTLGLVSHPITTTVQDQPVVISFMALDSCDGALGVMRRNWTMSDACGNSRSFHQTVVFDAPGNQLVNTQHWRPADADLAPADRDITGPNRLHSIAPKVDQLADRCNPGKKVTTGRKTFGLVLPTITQPRCSAGRWTETACRLGAEEDTEFISSIDLVHDFPADFAAFPLDVNIDTSSSLSPDVLGRPTGVSHCDTPFTISYQDAPPQQQDCGLWTIERTWKIQPYYADCGGVEATYPDVLTQKRVQLITVTDIAPPQFIQTPSPDLFVEFLEDYGSSVTGVPLVEDVAENSEMAKLAFISYPITLWYQDVNIKFYTDQASHREGMAVLSRLWTTRDACANTATWQQTIRVRNPNSGRRAGPLGNIGNYTAFSTQEVQAHSTTFAGSLGSYSQILLQTTTPTKVSSNLIPRYNDTITEFSAELFSFRARLFNSKPNTRSGPTAILCTGVLQHTCHVLRMATPTKAAVSYDAAGNMLLEGNGLLYNIFNDIDIDDWRYLPPKVVSKMSPLPAPVQTIRAEGFVIINIVYSNLDASKTMLRETKFEQRFPAGDAFVLYNLKNIPEQPIQNMVFSNTKLTGSLISQQAWNELIFDNTVVTGQVIAMHKRLTMDYCVFSGHLFPPNYCSP